MSVDNLYNSPDVVKIIKSRAKGRGVALKDILSDLGLGVNTFSHMNHGKAIAFDSLARIADYLDCSVDYLLGRVEAPSAIWAGKSSAQQGQTAVSELTTVSSNYFVEAQQKRLAPEEQALLEQYRNASLDIQRAVQAILAPFDSSLQQTKTG